MTVSALIPALIALAALAYACYIFFYKVPADLRSIYRYRIWALHDRMTDDVLTGALPDNAIVRRLIASAGLTIDESEDVTALHLLAVPAASWKATEARKAKIQREREEMSPEQLKKYDAYFRELGVAFFKHLALGSPSGWMMLATLFPAFVGAGLVSMVYRGGVRLRESCGFPFSYATEKMILLAEEFVPIASGLRAPVTQPRPLTTVAG